MVKIAISLGDINGVGAEIALKAHSEISKFCKPIYCINKSLLSNAAKLLKTDIPQDISLIECGSEFEIKPAKISKKSGKFSFISFILSSSFFASSEILEDIYYKKLYFIKNILILYNY